MLPFPLYSSIIIVSIPIHESAHNSYFPWALRSMGQIQFVPLKYSLRLNYPLPSHRVWLRFHFNMGKSHNIPFCDLQQVATNEQSFESFDPKFCKRWRKLICFLLHLEYHILHTSPYFTLEFAYIIKISVMYNKNV